jgi:hypothetical protein
MKGLELSPAAEEAEEEEEPEEEAEAEGGTSWDDLQAMDRTALKKVNAEEQLGVRVVKSMSDDDLREAIAEAMEIEVPAKEEPEEAEEEEAEEADSSAAPSDDYDEWTEDDLREELGDRNLPPKGPKGVLIRRLRKDDAQQDKPF